MDSTKYSYVETTTKKLRENGIHIMWDEDSAVS